VKAAGPRRVPRFWRHRRPSSRCTFQSYIFPNQCRVLSHFSCVLSCPEARGRHAGPADAGLPISSRGRVDFRHQTFPRLPPRRFPFRTLPTTRRFPQPRFHAIDRNPTTTTNWSFGNGNRMLIDGRKETVLPYLLLVWGKAIPRHRILYVCAPGTPPAPSPSAIGTSS
jgi:hypothetical protein